MAAGDGDLRAARRYGIGFAVLFTVALTALLGDLFGAFADSAESFTAYFDSRGQRIRHALGAYLLAGSGLAFLAFAVTSTAAADRVRERAGDVVMARLAAAVCAAATGIGAAALSTVSLSIGFGRITGDPGIRDAEELLPQLGYVVVVVPAALSAGLTICLIAHAAARSAALPRWAVAAGYVAGTAQLLSFYSLPLLLLPLWVLAASAALRQPPSA